MQVRQMTSAFYQGMEGWLFWTLSQNFQVLFGLRQKITVEEAITQLVWKRSDRSMFG